MMDNDQAAQYQKALSIHGTCLPGQPVESTHAHQ
jgi:hypothetical protein